MKVRGHHLYSPIGFEFKRSRFRIENYYRPDEQAHCYALGAFTNRNKCSYYQLCVARVLL